MKAYRIIPIVFCLLAAGCQANTASENAQDTAVELPAKTYASPTSRETTVGPVHAVVLLSDEHPRLGQSIELTLKVDAEAGVNVTMPEFGDQLGKYSIANYKSSDSIREDGRNEYSQTYTLYLPMSGRLRTPAFLVEFKDGRPDSQDKEKIHELLTDEISFEALSVFADDETPEELYPAKGALEELVMPETSHQRGWLWGLIALFAAAAAVAIIWARKSPKGVKALPADVIALTALSKMKEEGIPTDGKAVDAWYVNLSSIVRHYLENRFDLQAPRLTTEEFFELAKRNTDLCDAHKQLLKHLLDTSDRVKFTDFVPSAGDSQKVLDDAFQFVRETRITEEPEDKNSQDSTQKSSEKRDK